MRFTTKSGTVYRLSDIKVNSQTGAFSAGLERLGQAHVLGIPTGHKLNTGDVMNIGFWEMPKVGMSFLFYANQMQPVTTSTVVSISKVVS